MDTDGGALVLVVAALPGIGAHGQDVSTVGGMLPHDHTYHHAEEAREKAVQGGGLVGTRSICNIFAPQRLDGWPDLVMRQDLLQSENAVSREMFRPGNCDVVEGKLTPGRRRLLRFTAGIANVGAADLFIGNPDDYAASGFFVYAPCHGHYHFKNYARYELVAVKAGKTWTSSKIGFCMLDSMSNPSNYSNALSGGNMCKYTKCGNPGVLGHQGISAGFGDLYPSYLSGQYVVLDGGAKDLVTGLTMKAVPRGLYDISLTVNVAFAPPAGCAIDLSINDLPSYPPLKDRALSCCPYPSRTLPGMCHVLPESNYTNNNARVRIQL